MKTSEKIPTQKLVWISLALNFLFSIIILPKILQPFSSLSVGQLSETLFWQGLGLVTWPLALFMKLFSSLFSGNLPRLRDTFSIILFPLIEINLILLLVLKKNRWVPLILSHILVLISFTITWIAVLKGYNFMVD